MSGRRPSLRKKKSSAVPLFAAVTCRQSAPDYPKGNGEKIRGVETLVSIPLVRPRGVSARSRAPQSATLRLIQAKNLPPIRGEHANAVRVPHSAGAEKDCRPDRANTLTQFEYPAQPVQRKEPPRQGEHACGSSSAPLSRCREKGYRPLGANRLCGSCTPVSRCRIEKKTIFNRKNLRKPARTDCASHLYLL